eukprot:TRINITY_DN27173_c0_g1_i1.p2 TRINITY_DN27173_c0_g1~~TRINITY_DN27173_c0_g1_i1.p2  ORF type:complete len:295 (-),score=46.53 TRINITY_DN27173_c0_g1_i1:456-1340(-)
MEQNYNVYGELFLAYETYRSALERHADLSGPLNLDRIVALTKRLSGAPAPRPAPAPASGPQPTRQQLAMQLISSCARRPAAALAHPGVRSAAGQPDKTRAVGVGPAGGSAAARPLPDSSVPVAPAPPPPTLASRVPSTSQSDSPSGAQRPAVPASSSTADLMAAIRLGASLRPTSSSPRPPLNQRPAAADWSWWVAGWPRAEWRPSGRRCCCWQAQQAAARRWASPTATCSGRGSPASEEAAPVRLALSCRAAAWLPRYRRPAQRRPLGFCPVGLQPIERLGAPRRQQDGVRSC